MDTGKPMRDYRVRKGPTPLCICSFRSVCFGFEGCFVYRYLTFSVSLRMHNHFSGLFSVCYVVTIQLLVRAVQCVCVCVCVCVRGMF